MLIVYGTHHGQRSPESLADLERAAQAFAAKLHSDEKPREQVVICLEERFNRLDGHMPSLVSPPALP